MVIFFQITWLDKDENKFESDDIENEVKPIENTKRETIISTLTLTAKKSHHNTTLTCQAQNQAMPLPQSTHIRMNVQYAPHVTVKADHQPIFEGEDVTFTCEAHANPSIMTFR